VNKITRFPEGMFLSVYLAGKVRCGCDSVADWRFFLLPYQDESITPESLGETLVSSLKRKIESDGELIWAPITCPQWTYAGPFWTSWHGALEEESHETIFKRNMESIRKCDMLFAFIDSEDCYGTLAEIGFAHALGKSIYIVFDYPLRYRMRDYWFITQCAQSADICENKNQLVRVFDIDLRREDARRKQAIKISG
jgi:hypothetical protein